MSRTILIVGLVLGAVVGRCWARELSPGVGNVDRPLPVAEVRKAIERSTGYLAREGIKWKQKQQCASCHHIPYMVWALNEARDRGYPIDDRALDEVMSWALAEPNHAQVFPDLPLDKKHSETDYLGPLLMALGVGAGEHRPPTQESARRRLIAHALTQQAADGSWNPNSDRGRPPVHSTRDVQTSLLLLALSDPLMPGDSQDPWKAQRASVADWLSRNSPADSHQGRAMRLLVNRRLDKPADESAPLLKWVLEHQNDDGGWSQTPTMKSDAVATGMALYALSGRQTPEVESAVRRATLFLLEAQLPDGAWPMASRHAEPTGPGPASDLGPIKYVGTAWATIGLVRTAPAIKSAGTHAGPED
jgi:hypothetical protein